MSAQTYLIDTNVIIGLEDHHTIQPAFSALLSTAQKHKVDVMVHEAARDDLQRDKDAKRRQISLSKLEKFQTIGKVRDLQQAELEHKFGTLTRHNDVVDATLLDTLERGAADFLVTEDRGLHERARRFSPELGRRVLFVADAVQLLKTTYEPKEAPVCYVEELAANQVQLTDDIFDILHDGYPEFDDWWREKCVRQRRPCWAVFDNGFAGLIVRKDETGADTDATIKAAKILKIYTFKVRPEKRGVKLGELLLKKAFWFAQTNNYDLAYITTFEDQVVLIDLLEYYGFEHTATKANGELVYEKRFSRAALHAQPGTTPFETDRLSYPSLISARSLFRSRRAITTPSILICEIRVNRTCSKSLGSLEEPRSPAIPSERSISAVRNLISGRPDPLLLFYKGKSIDPPSQALSAIGIFEEVSIAKSTEDLVHLTGGRSVYEAYSLNAKLVPQLMDLLQKRNAIPKQRLDYFDDPQFRSDRIKGSHRNLFERNSTVGIEIYQHPHFLKYLRYFLFGADLLPNVLDRFKSLVNRHSPISGGDVQDLSKLAKDLVNEHRMEPHEASGEFFKVCLDCGCIRCTPLRCATSFAR
jgi:predicted nucleic acid-binding protein